MKIKNISQKAKVFFILALIVVGGTFAGKMGSQFASETKADLLSGQTFTCTVNPYTATTGQQVTWQVTAVNPSIIPADNSTFHFFATYYWGGDDNLTSSNDQSPTVTHTYNNAGTYHAHATASIAETSINPNAYDYGTTSIIASSTCQGALIGGQVAVTKPALKLLPIVYNLYTCSNSVPNGTCPSGQTCTNGTCQKPLLKLTPIVYNLYTCSSSNTTGTCPSGQSCSNGACLQNMYQAQPTPINIIQHATPINITQQVPSTLTCSSSNLTGTCSDPTQTCQNGVCVSNTTSTPPPASQCQSDSDCGGNGLVCQSGQCVASSSGIYTSQGSQQSGPNYTPPPDILACKVINPQLILSENLTSAVICHLQPPAVITAWVVKGDYTPPTLPDPTTIVKTLTYQTASSDTILNYSWNGIDQYDQPAADGDYSFVVMAQQPGNSIPALSVHIIQVMQNPPPQTQTQTTTPANLNPAAPTPPAPPAAPPTPPPPPTPSKCPGLNYPNDIAYSPEQNYIMAAYDHCIFNGYSDGSFHPDGIISRAEALKAMLVTAGIPPRQGCYTTGCGSPFLDLDTWQGQWVRPAWDRKMITGLSKILFGPNQPITRGQAAVLIAKIFKLTPHKGCYTANCGAGYPYDFFLDITDKVQGSYLRTLWDKGIIQGTGANLFEPNRPMTRAEMAALIVKTAVALGRMQPPALTTTTNQTSGTQNSTAGGQQTQTATQQSNLTSQSQTVPSSQQVILSSPNPPTTTSGS